ncbi:MAG: transposase [Candidatus Lernaella stagnicola]|nr:transposase [Candidatus Lernaella stagnicola]
MARNPRIVVAGYPHHVTHRGNRGEKIFRSDKDRQKYLALLKKYVEQYEVAVLSYCLMPNHVHLVLVPTIITGLAGVLHDTHGVYATYFNETHETTGHLWQGRYYSTPMDERHMWAAIRYVERNSVRAGMACHAADYRWSSAPAHCGKTADPLIKPSPLLDDRSLDWPWFLSGEEDPYEKKVRTDTMAGMPCGSPFFVAFLEILLGRKFSAEAPETDRRPVFRPAPRLRKSPAQIPTQTAFPG